MLARRHGSIIGTIDWRSLARAPPADECRVP
jgi:hypothetical protein